MTAPRSSASRRDLIVAGSCGVFVALMVGAAYAAVPLYDWFCRTTGFAGTTQVAASAPTQVLDHEVTVRFDANVDPGLPWRFSPDERLVKVKLGEVATVTYSVLNQAARGITAAASYNVSPPQAGAYFTKINCFCFTEQHLAAGEKQELTVVFYVDPSLLQDIDHDDLNTITLSYTMHAVRERAPVVEGRGSTPPRG